MDVRIVDQNPDVCLAVWERTVIHVWRGQPTVESIAKMVATCNELISSSRAPVTYLSIVERSSPPPEQPVREALAQWSRDVVPKMVGAVIVAEGSGFRAALVRGVGVALTTLMPHRIPFKFVSNVDDAIDHLAPKLPVASGGAAALRSVVESLRTTIPST